MLAGGLFGHLPVMSQVFVGYCTGDVATTGIGNSNVSATISCAAAFPSSDALANYQSCNLGMVKVGVSATEGLTSFRVWVREHLYDENLVAVDVPVEDLVVGWNEIALPLPVAVEGHDTLYCGYDYTQSVKNVHVISYGGAKKTPLSFWIANGGKWRDYTSNYGPLSIYAGIEARSAHGVRLCDLSLSCRCQPYQPDGTQYQPISIEGVVQNLGDQPLTSFILRHSDNGLQPVQTLFSWPDAVPFGGYASFSYTVVPGQGVQAPRPDIPLAFAIDQPNAAQDATIVDGERTLYYDLYDSTQVSASMVNVIEEFTSELCGFAPLGQQRLREAVSILTDEAAADADVSPAYVILSHHEGFGPADPWRVTERTDYSPLLFGPDRLTFAPAALVNRSGLPFSTTLPVDSLVTLLDAAASRSYADLTAEATLGEDGNVRAQVTVRPCVLSFCQNPQLVLCLVQPEVASVDAHNYYPEWVDATVQRDVIRCYLHNVSGSDALLQGADMAAVMKGQAPVQDYWDAASGEGLVYEYQGKIPADITDISGLRLVAYIYDKGNTGRIYATYSAIIGQPSTQRSSRR